MRGAVRRVAFPCLALVWGAIAAPVTATTPDGYRVAFVTSTLGFGNLGDSNDAGHWVETNGTGLTGLEAGDKICQVRAEAVGLATAGSPVFRAWLSDSLDDAYCHVQGLTGKRFDISPCDGGTEIGGGPWVLVDGELFARDLANFTSPLPGGPLRPPLLDENGAFLYSKNFYTGTKEDGTRSNTGNDCNGWSDGTAGFNVAGGTTDSLASWSGGAGTGCNFQQRLLCLEQGTGTNPPLPREPGALVFVSSEAGSGGFTDWTSSGGLGGIAGADAACQSLADLAGLPAPESFVAYLSTSSTDAKDRLTIDGPWKRLDGFRIAATKAELINNYIDVPIWIDDAGGVAFDEVWTGTNPNGTKTSNTCYSWADGTAGFNGDRGLRYRNHAGWASTGPTPCGTPRHVYCFSNVVSIFWDGFESSATSRWSAVAP